MKLSVQPVAAVPVADFQNHVGVFLQNKGLGPMRIRIRPMRRWRLRLWDPRFYQKSEHFTRKVFTDTKYV